jgi:hypothetical protein
LSIQAIIDTNSRIQISQMLRKTCKFNHTKYDANYLSTINVYALLIDYSIFPRIK